MAAIRPLLPSDDRASFRSGDPDLDSFFWRYAGQNQFRHHLGVTYVLVENTSILGFATVAPSEVGADEMPRGFGKKLPRYPLPVLRLARLAVDERVRGKGHGLALIRHVFTLAIQLAADFGCVGVVVDAKPGADRFYEGLGFEHLSVLEGESPARPRPAPMFLALDTIRATL